MITAQLAHHSQTISQSEDEHRGGGRAIALEDELLIDELSDLSRSINQLLRDLDRGNDATAQLEAIKKQVKGIATDLGFTKEVVKKYQQLSSLQTAHLEAGLDSADLQHLGEEKRLKGQPTQVVVNGRSYSID
jgi:hypothetical protein